MKLIWYPDYDEREDNSAVQKFIRKDLAKHESLREKVEDLLNKIELISSLDPLFRSGQLKSLKSGLFEIRIPQQAKGGVVRIYFCMSITEKDTLVLLDAELKKDKEPARLENARDRMAKYLQYCKG